MLEHLSLPEKKSVVERYARLLALVGGELGERHLVLPNGESFPDRFTPDASGLRTLTACMLRHAGLSDVPVAARVVEEPSDAGGGGCGSGCGVTAGSCGTSPGAGASESGAVPRLVDTGTSFTLNVPAAELRHPVVLTTMVARALGHVFLVEALPAGARIEHPPDLTADHAAVALGFGPLLLEGSYVYSKSCGGPQVASVTHASIAELAFSTALFIEMRGQSGRRALAELGATQQAALGEALEWARSNDVLIQRLRREPERVAGGDYELREPRPWLLRLFGGKSKDAPMAAPVSPPRAPRAVDPAHAELRALVDEALEASPVDAE
ncbi:MAG TPA: hypothetical protein VF395_08195 [Polyangiaceae bacterium]